MGRNTRGGRKMKIDYEKEKQPLEEKPNLTEEEWNDLTKDQQGDWIEYWSNLEEEIER